MEGTRHERAALVGVAYFLGFLTTFIWLGVNSSASLPSAAIETAAQPASVIQATAPSVAPEVKDSAVSYNNGILEVTTLGETRALSFNPELSGVEATEEFMTQGVHYGTLAYTASPTEEYVFFCELKAVDAKTCLPFVYDSLSQTIYPLRKDGDKVELLVEAATKATWEGNQLMVGGELANDATKPWLLGY